MQAGLLIVAVVVLIAMAALFPLVSLWLQASFSGAPISLASLIGMRLRKVDPRVIVYSRIRAVKAGLNIATDQLETHYLGGGRVLNVMTAMISAKKAAVPLSWDVATAIDFSGRDIVEAVRSAANFRKVACGVGDPPVIECQTADGALLRVTVEAECRTNVNRLVGGADLETLKQRICDAVGEIVTESSEADRVISNPSIIERRLSQAGLDDGTAWTVARYCVRASRVDR